MHIIFQGIYPWDFPAVTGASWNYELGNIPREFPRKQGHINTISTPKDSLYEKLLGSRRVTNWSSRRHICQRNISFVRII